MGGAGKGGSWRTSGDRKATGVSKLNACLDAEHLRRAYAMEYRRGKAIERMSSSLLPCNCRRRSHFRVS